MELRLERTWKKPTYTIGRLFVNGEFFCNILEDADRGLKQTDSLQTIKSKKVKGKTAIPTGRYKISMSFLSPKYSKIPSYQRFCGGLMPRLLDVPGYDIILIHPGNTIEDTDGCLLPGKNTIVGQVTSSLETWRELYLKMKMADFLGESIYIEIV